MGVSLKISRARRAQLLIFAPPSKTSFRRLCILLNKRGCAEGVDPIGGEDHLRVEVRELSKLEDTQEPMAHL